MPRKSENQTEQKYDDLTIIKGIKQARQQWFRETFDVRTFRDLAALSVDEIESRLKAEKQIPSRSKIESWLAEAKQFAENLGMVTAAKVKLSTKEDDWKPFASFVVEFQEQNSEGEVEVRTRVHYIESDQTRTWIGVDQHDLCQWITQQLGDKAKPPVLQTAPEVKTPVVEKLTGVALKPAAAEMVSAPEPPPPTAEIPAIPIIQPAFSDQLQHILAMAARTSGTIIQMTVASTPAPSPNQLELAASVAAQSEAPIVTTAAGSPDWPSNKYSDKLQHLIAKEQRLSSKQP